MNSPIQRVAVAGAGVLGAQIAFQSATHGLGVESGEGFYTYPDPAYLRPDFLA
jgi:3-hydroxyacyl-CoA dehydrogenase